MAYGIGPLVFVVCNMAMPVIVLNTGGVRNAPVNLVEMGEPFGSRFQVIMKIILPSAFPIIFAGLRLGVSAGFIGAILSELKIARQGLAILLHIAGLSRIIRACMRQLPQLSFLPCLLNVLERIENKLCKGLETSALD